MVVFRPDPEEPLLKGLLLFKTTHTEIARALGVSRISVVNWINNKHKMRLHHQVALRSMLGDKIKYAESHQLTPSQEKKLLEAKKYFTSVK